MSEFNEGTIRKATADDYDEIMSIYQDEEADYLPDYFHLLLRNPNTTAYVYIIKGQIVNIKIRILMMYFYFMSSNINVGETWSDNQEWIIGRHSQHWAHKKQDKDKTKQKTQHKTEN